MTTTHINLEEQFRIDRIKRDDPYWISRNFGTDTVIKLSSLFFKDKSKNPLFYWLFLAPLSTDIILLNYSTYLNVFEI